MEKSVEQQNELTIHVLTDIKSESKVDVLRELNELLKDSGNVKSTYFNAVLEREKVFPTGIKLNGNLNVALPHADTDHVLKNGFAIGILENPIEFSEMANPDGRVMVHIIFLMAAVSPQAIIGFLQRLSEEVFMKKDIIKAIYDAKSEKAIKNILEGILFEEEA